MGCQDVTWQLFYSGAVRKHLIGVGLVVVGGHTGDEAGEAAELDEEVVLANYRGVQDINKGG